MAFSAGVTLSNSLPLGVPDIVTPSVYTFPLGLIDDGVAVTVATPPAIDKAKFLEKFGIIPTDLGYAINSNMIKKVFKHEKTIPVSKAKFDKTKIYEMMLPSIVVVATLIDIKDKK